MDLVFFDEHDRLNLRIAVGDTIEAVQSISLTTSVMKSTIALGLSILALRISKITKSKGQSDPVLQKH